MPAKDEKRELRLRVPVLPEEAAEIRRLAKAAGLPVAAYLRQVGQGYRLRGVIDHERIRELATMSADLRRLGDLLELWLQDDPRTRQFGEATIRAVLAKTEETHGAACQLLRSLVQPDSRKRL
ncbi:hypothetical protein IP91_04063 [Pseudoduganella lurida]|uniref:Conjugal transfer protein TraJ n=1 Tax=Pseudoduganella lurida TaxID=1036180 RepID=A0A562R0E9_9BURK|nr:conjugal transfer transcriptional regulator TraJ [Pseudoduganella lurida]TWI62542.1 hypothetical protein IP91_04063 [Pseudoduganella lurida]